MKAVNEMICVNCSSEVDRDGWCPKCETGVTLPSVFSDCDISPESQMKAIAEHIHYPECWDTMAYPTLASAVCEITCCDPVQCSHPSRDEDQRNEGGEL